MAATSGSSKREVLRVALVGATLVLAAAVLFSFMSGKIIPEAFYVAPAIVSMLVYALYLRISFKVYTAAKPSTDRKGPLEDIRAMRANAQAMRSALGPTSMAWFYQTLCEPHSVIDRITETVSGTVRSMQVSTSLTIRLPRVSDPVTLLVPVSLYARGALQDGLRIYNSAGDRISSVTRGDTACYIAAVIRELVDNSCDSDAAILEYDVSLQDDVLGLLCSSRPASPTEVCEITDAMFSLPAASDGRLLLRYACEIVRAVSTQYPLLVEVRHDAARHVHPLGFERVRIVVDRRMTPTLVRASGLFARGRDAVRRLLGIPPAVLSFPLVNAGRARSYHVEVRGPEGTYLGRQRVVTYPSGVEVDLAGRHYALRRRLGQRHSHLYIRDDDSSDWSARYFENYFFERVPGTVGIAAMSAAGAAALIVISALSRLGSIHGGTSDLVVALLAFPAIAGTWMGLDSRGGALGGNLVSRLSSIVTVFTSVTAAISFLVLPMVDTPTGPLNGRTWAWLSILLCAAALLNAIATCGSWLLRSATQSALQHRSSNSISRLSEET